MVRQTAPRRTQQLAIYGTALLALLVLTVGTVASFVEWSYGGEGPLDVWWFIWPPTWLLSGALTLVSTRQARSGLTSALCWWAADIPLWLGGVPLLKRIGDNSLVSGLVFIVVFDAGALVAMARFLLTTPRHDNRGLARGHGLAAYESIGLACSFIRQGDGAFAGGRPHMDEAQHGNPAPPPPRDPLLTIIFTVMTVLALVGGTVLVMLVATENTVDEGQIALAGLLVWPLSMFVVWLLGHGVFFATRATRSTGSGMALLAWLGVCVLATLGLFPVGIVFTTVGVADIVAVGAALILIDVGVVYAGWRLIRSRRRTL